MSTFWALTTFFNPANYKNKYENYKKFRELSKRQGLNLITVELAFNGAPFELQKDDAEILVQVRSNSVMWQKERLLNIGLKHLPPDCDKVAWIGCDIIFQNDNWIKEASDLLDKYNVIQLFSFFVSLPSSGKIENFFNMHAGYRSGNFGNFEIGRVYGTLLQRKKFGGVPGIAWAAKRKIFVNLLFLDRLIIGSADEIMARAFFGETSPIVFNFPIKLISFQNEWIKKVRSLVDSSCYFLNNICMHLWHGDYSDRKYKERYEIVNKYDFDPKTDLKISSDGVFEWASEKLELHKEIRDYFFSRRESARESVPIPIRTHFSGSFWGITTFFNPTRCKNKYENYKIFREFSKRQGLKLLAVELAFGKDFFMLEDEDADIIIRLRTDRENILWQKEAMLNVGLKNLPVDCDKIVWLDSDVIFQNNDWISQTCELLEQYVVVQPFEICALLGEGKDYGKINVEKMDFGVYDNSKRHGIVYTKENFFNNSGHPGFVWAARREIFDQIGFYDRAVLCGADSMMAYAFYGTDNHSQRLSPAFAKDYLNWLEKASVIVAGRVHYTKGVLVHLWHGSYKGRLYEHCLPLLKKFGFEPACDIKKNDQGVWEWFSEKKALHLAIFAWFKAKNEEAHTVNIFSPIFLFFLKFYPKPRAFFNAEVILLIYQRPHNFKKILDAFSRQTYKNFKLNIFNNDINLKTALEGIVKKFPKLDIFLEHSKKNLGSMAKFQVAKKTYGNPLIFIDDDMIPDKDFVEYMVNEYEKYSPKCILGWHAFQFLENSYLRGKKQPDYGSQADFAGSGSIVLDRDIFENIPEIYSIPGNAKKMEDIWLSYCARRRGYKIIKIEKKVNHIIDGLDQHDNLKQEKEKFFRELRQSGWNLLKI